MSKSRSQRVRDYRIGKAHIDFYVIPEIKKRFVELAQRYRLSQSELLEELVAVGETTPIQVNKKRITKEESEALLLLDECNGDHDAAIRRLAQDCRDINPRFVYNPRPGETPEETALRNRFERIRSKLLNWKKKGNNTD
ncbi:MAG TPA: hypothetical protein VMJ66_07355 [Geobacteraceae bacterium]|nr:hypothetical protein [Geobacteraceae bacterium]